MEKYNNKPIFKYLAGIIQVSVWLVIMWRVGYIHTVTDFFRLLGIRIVAEIVIRTLISYYKQYRSAKAS